MCVCIERTKQEEPSTDLPPRFPSLFQKQPRKKVYKNILQEFFKFTVACRRCTHQPAPPPSAPAALSLGHLGPRPTLPRQTDRQTAENTATAPSLNREVKKVS